MDHGVEVRESRASPSGRSTLRSEARFFLLCLAGSLAITPLAVGREKYDVKAAETGAGIYRTHCATCHGTVGKGDGPMAPQLRIAPPDLTLLARRNGGKFSFEKVYRIIDGRDPVPGHGGGDMPVWGDAFLEAREGYSEEKVKERITQVVHYVASIQAE
jgi:mono/diheme cytochrome c family protein